jgi:hypothetical protein
LHLTPKVQRPIECAEQGQDGIPQRFVIFVQPLTLWKDADPDIPILKEAKAEYAKLQ